MSGALLWSDQGDRQTPLEAVSQALHGLDQGINEAAVSVLADEINPAIDKLLTADIPAALLPLCGAAGVLARRLEAELESFRRIILAARRPGGNDGGSVTAFASIAAELRGLGRAVAAVMEEFGPLLEAEAAARDRATIALSLGEARTSFANPDVIAFRTAPVTAMEAGADA